MKNIKLSELNTAENSHIIFKNAHIIDPAQNIDIIGNLSLKGKKLSILENSYKLDETATIIDCTNLLICPGLIDTHIQAKNINASGIQNISDIAISSGITSLILSPQSSTIIDTPELISLTNELIKKYSKINMYISAALTKNLEGQAMAEYKYMKKMGAHCLSNGTKAIADTNLLFNIMNYTASDNFIIHGIPIEPYLNCPEREVNSSLLSSYMGLHNIPEEAELIALDRNLYLITKTQSKYNAIVSSSKAVNNINKAKLENPNVSASTSIFHLSFNENDIGDYNTKYKIFLPLRSENNRKKLIEEIEKNNINIITSLHIENDNIVQIEDFNNTNLTNFGIQLLLPLALRLYHNKHLSLYRIIETLTKEPATIFNIQDGSLKYSNFIIIDPNEPCIINNHALQGVVKATFVEGNLIYLNR